MTPLFIYLAIQAIGHVIALVVAAVEITELDL